MKYNVTTQTQTQTQLMNKEMNKKPTIQYSYVHKTFYRDEIPITNHLACRLWEEGTCYWKPEAFAEMRNRTAGNADVEYAIARHAASAAYKVACDAAFLTYEKQKQEQKLKQEQEQEQAGYVVKLNVTEGARERISTYLITTAASATEAGQQAIEAEQNPMLTDCGVRIIKAVTADELIILNKFLRD